MNTHSVKFNSAFDASHFAIFLEGMGATDINIILKDNWYNVDYTIDNEDIQAFLETV